MFLDADLHWAVKEKTKVHSQVKFKSKLDLTLMIHTFLKMHVSNICKYTVIHCMGSPVSL